MCEKGKNIVHFNNVILDKINTFSFIYLLKMMCNHICCNENWKLVYSSVICQYYNVIRAYIHWLMLTFLDISIILNAWKTIYLNPFNYSLSRTV